MVNATATLLQGTDESIYLTFLNKLQSPVYNKIVLVLIVIFLGFLIGRVVGKLTQNFLHSFHLNKIIQSAGIKITIEEIVGIDVTLIIYLITILYVLRLLHITKIVLFALFGVFGFFLIIFFLLGAKDMFLNIIAGMLVNRRGRLKPNDLVKVGDIKGQILKLGIFETRIKTKENDVIIIPNTTLIGERVTLLREH